MVSFSVTLEDSDDDRLFTIVSPVFLSCWPIIWELFASYPVTSSIEIKNMHQIIKKNHTVYFNMQDLKFLWITIESISGNLCIYSYPYPNMDFQISCQQVGLPKTRILSRGPTPNANTWLWRLVIRVYWINQVPLRVIMEVAAGAHVMRWASGAPIPSPTSPSPPKMHISTSGWSSLACSTQAAARKKGRATPLLLFPPMNSAFLSNCDVIHDQWLWLSLN